jgi:hypothetical protein
LSGRLARNTTRCTTRFSRSIAEGGCRLRLRINSCTRTARHGRLPTVTTPAELVSFFGDEWIRTGGIAEFTGGGIEGARHRPRRMAGEDHALNLTGVMQPDQDAKV